MASFGASSVGHRLLLATTGSPVPAVVDDVQVVVHLRRVSGFREPLFYV